MLLILTNSTDATADYMAARLKEQRIDFVRFDTDKSLDYCRFDFASLKPRLQLDGHWWVPEDFSNVWYRRPERVKRNGIPDEGDGKLILDEWSEVLDGFLAQIPRPRWMNYPAANVLASNKIQQLTLAATLGLTIPDTLVTQDPDALRAFARRHNGRIIVKPMSVGHVDAGKDSPEAVIYTNAIEARQLDDLADLVICPTLFQELVEKEVDVRITVVDREVTAVDLAVRDRAGVQLVDVRRDNMRNVTYKRRVLPDAVHARLSALMGAYGLRYAAIDMAVTACGEWVFFEINPNGQWAWIDLNGGASIFASFVRSFDARGER